MAPRLSAATSRKRNPAGAPLAVGSVPGNNALAGEEAERVQLISIVSQLSAAEDEIEAAKAPLKAAQKKRSSIIGLGKAAGFTAKELERRLDEMKRGTRENAEIAAREHKHRRWLGILDADQAALILGDQAPQEVKDEAHWKGEGYKAGLRQMLQKPPPECPERFVQPWLAEHSRGHLEVTTANAPKQTPSAKVGEQAAKDFAEDEPGLDVDAAERKLRNDPAFMARGPAEDEGAEEAPETPAADLNVDDDDCAFCGAAPATSHAPGCRALGGQVGATSPDAPFEATEEELAAQQQRRAVQDARDGRTSGEDDGEVV